MTGAAVRLLRSEHAHTALVALGLGTLLVRLLLPPLVSMLLLAVPLALLALWLLWRATQPRYTVRSPLALPLLLACGALVASSTLAVADGATLVAVLFFWGAVDGLLLFLLIDMLAAGWSPRVVERAVLLVATLLLLLALAQLVAWCADWWRAWQPGLPLLPPFEGHNFLGMHHTAAVMPYYLALPLAMLAAWRARTRLVLAAGLVWLLCDMLVIFSTGARGGWLAMIAGGGATLLLLLHAARRAGEMRRAVGALLLATGGALLFAALLVGSSAQVAADVTAALHPGVPQEELLPDDPQETLENLVNPMGRGIFWRRALIMVHARPLLGVGPGGYSVAYRSLATPRELAIYVPPHPHSLYLATLSELGVVGTLAFAALALAAVWHWWHWWRALLPLSDAWHTHVGAGVAFAALALHGLVEVPPPQVGALALALGVASVAHCWRTSEAAPAKRALHWPHPLHLAIALLALLVWGVATLVAQRM